MHPLALLDRQAEIRVGALERLHPSRRCHLFDIALSPPFRYYLNIMHSFAMREASTPSLMIKTFSPQYSLVCALSHPRRTLLAGRRSGLRIDFRCLFLSAIRRPCHSR